MQATHDSNYEPEQQHQNRHHQQTPQTGYAPVKTKADIFISALLYGALERI